MANVVIPENPEFNEALRIIETKDLVHADVVNPMFRTLLLNTIYLERRVAKMIERIDTLAIDNTYGGPELSADANIVDASAQFSVIRKTSSTASVQTLFQKAIDSLRKGLYSLLIRVKVNSNSNNGGLIELNVTSGGAILETRIITANMFERAGVYQTFGLNVELNDTVTITARFLKNGFVDVTSKVNVATGSGLLRGDVLLNEAHHVAMYCGNGKEVEASINEKGTAHGGKPGDQTGKEFLIRSYRNYPWNCVLRYRGNIFSASDTEKKQNAVAYVARFTKDCKCYSAAGKTQAKMFPVIKKNAVVDVMKYTETVNGKKWYFIRIPHPTEGFVREFVPAGYFKKLI